MLNHDNIIEFSKVVISNVFFCRTAFVSKMFQFFWIFFSFCTFHVNVKLTPSYIDGLFDPRGRPHFRPVVITIFTQVIHPSVRPKLQNQSKITAGRDCGLAEWIIGDSCLVFLISCRRLLRS